MAQTQMIRVEQATHAKLVEVAADQKITLTELVARMAERYRREIFLEKVAADYAELKNDPQAWEEEQKEWALWDNTNMDGLEEE